jgi:hypothetical protein
VNLNEIYGEMRSKYGWNDGDLEPRGSYEARNVIVKYINKHLPPDCPVEAFGYDRPGMHNGALISYRKKGLTDEQALAEEEAPEPEEIWDILRQAEENCDIEMYLQIVIDTEEM